MEIRIKNEVPEGLTAKKSYDTTYIYTGFGRLDVFRKKFQKFARLDGTLSLTEVDHGDPLVVPRGYCTERVRVTEYSDYPRMWSEALDGVGTIHFFQQVIQTASTS